METFYNRIKIGFMALLEEVMYNDISHTQCPSPAFHAGLNRNDDEPLILVNGSMSKGLGRQAGLRYNPYLTSEAHQPLLESSLNIEASHVHNLAAVALHYTAPHFAEFAQESPVYLDNAKAIGAVLNQHPDILVHDPEMGPFTFVNIGEICNKTGLTPDGVTEYLLVGLEHAIVSALTGKSFLLEGDHAATLRISACGFNDPEQATIAAKVILAALSDTERMRAFAKAADPQISLKDGEIITIPNYYEGYMMKK